MKNVYKLKSGARAAVHAFKTGDFSGIDRISEHNDNILRDVFKRVQFGLSEYAFINTGDDNGGLIYCISRDSQYDLVVRVSVFVRYGSGADARIYASSHKVYSRVNEFLRCGLPSGRLVLVGGWYDKLKKGVAA